MKRQGKKKKKHLAGENENDYERSLFWSLSLDLLAVTVAWTEMSKKLEQVDFPFVTFITSRNFHARVLK